MTAQQRFRHGHHRRFEVAASVALAAALFVFGAAPPLPPSLAPVPLRGPEIVTVADIDPIPPPAPSPPDRPRAVLEPASIEPADVRIEPPDAPDVAAVAPPPAAGALTGAEHEAFRAYSSPPAPRIVVEPEYPEVARSLGIEGRVLCEVTIDDHGRVVAVTILESDSSLLDRAAREALVRWTFTPAMQSGQPVAATVVIPVLFRLR